MKKVLICGATGFLGRNIAEKLVETKEYQVFGVSHVRPEYDLPGLTWVSGDLRDATTVTKLVTGMDIVIQAAATTSGMGDMASRPYIHITDNAVMNSLLLRACFDCHVQKFLFFSCSLMYPSSPNPVKENEWDRSLDIPDPYFGIAHTKLYVENMCQFFAGLGRTDHTVIRLTNAYGPFDKFDLEHSKFFSATISKVMTTEDNHIVMWGPGDAERDMIYVSDVVSMVHACLRSEGNRFRLFNCGAGQAQPIKNIVQKIIDVSGRGLSIEHDLSKPSVSNALAFDCAKAHQELGWHPEVPLESGISKTIEWWKTDIDPQTLRQRSA